MSDLDDYMMRARIEHDRSCPRWERPLIAGVACDCSAHTLPFAARSELAALRATIAQQQRRIEAAGVLASVLELAFETHRFDTGDESWDDVEAALETFRKTALTKAFSELASTVDAIRTHEMEQSAMTKIANECGNDPPIGVKT